MVYLLHFNQPYPNGKRPQHYLGWAKDKRTYKKRVEHHAAGTSGVRLMEVVKAHDITFVVARTWIEGDKTLERKLKNLKNSKRICPQCKGE